MYVKVIMVMILKINRATVTGNQQIHYRSVVMGLIHFQTVLALEHLGRA